MCQIYKVSYIIYQVYKKQAGAELGQAQLKLELSLHLI